MDTFINTNIVPESEISDAYEHMSSVRRMIKSPSYAVVRTLGCQMNEHDSEKLAGMLEQMGYTIIDDYKSQKADLVIFNTCCIRENAEGKVLGRLGELKMIKRSNQEMIIAVCGCMTEQPHIVDIIKKKHKHVNLVFGTHDIHRFPAMLEKTLAANKNVYDISSTRGDMHEVPEGLPIRREDNTKAWVTVMYGCNNFCSYCIVPYVRGRERSRSPQDILAEIDKLDREGFKEITLLGQNVNSYGKDLARANDKPCSFALLLDDICDMLDKKESANIKRIRFMTSHPKDLSDQLIDVMARRSQICNQLHLPVQSGSTEILRRMNRRYSREQYLALVDKIRARIPSIALSTDIIVGFPGETEQDFEDTVSLVKQVRYDSAYTFIYSPRVGTPAASYDNQIDEETVKNRFNRLLDAHNTICREINDTYLGKTVEILVDGPSKTDPEHYTGRTSENKIVNFVVDESKISKEDIIGKIIKVEIAGIQTWSLDGKM
ncbi:MAG: tRNA (N6-isopentenyl adenosine(37)-C2)-methylthiotransferase MiaB [Ruminococcaceae bacterium]|nr:tRNA (N6-isopentenyl adenosine(37)-C2)-methylthiotransferase MiaB [Oscillospiraceae bacterium]